MLLPCLQVESYPRIKARIVSPRYLCPPGSPYKASQQTAILTRLPMPLQYLPPELLANICQHASLTDPAALSRTSSLFYVVTQPLFYRHVSVNLTSKNLGIVVTLAKKPHIARHVQTFAIRLDPHTAVLHSYYCRLSEALSNMSELTSLNIFVKSAASWVLHTRLDAEFPRLRHFASSFPLDSYVAHFLSKAEAILQLEVDSSPTSQLIAPSSLIVTAAPRLSRFIGSSKAAQAVIPGRPVDEIHLSSGDLTEVLVQGLSKSTAYVLLLGASTSSLPPPLLESLAEFMPQLKYLRMMTTYNLSDVLDPTLYQDTAKALALLPTLHSFELSGMHWGSSCKGLNGEGRMWQPQLFGVATRTLDVSPFDVYFAY